MPRVAAVQDQMDEFSALGEQAGRRLRDFADCKQLAGIQIEDVSELVQERHAQLLTAVLNLGNVLSGATDLSCEVGLAEPRRLA